MQREPEWVPTQGGLLEEVAFQPGQQGQRLGYEEGGGDPQADVEGRRRRTMGAMEGLRVTPEHFMGA